jgi:aldose 1-epimerase
VVIFSYVSPDGEENYPGELSTQIAYTIKPMELSWVITATTDKPTIVNIANHGYWNLDGLDVVIDDLNLKLNASKIMAADEENSPTGEINPVEGTAFDFREPKSFAQIFVEAGDLDHTYLLDGYTEKTDPMQTFEAAELYSPNTGRVMSIWTTEPAMIVYSGNSMDKLTSFGNPCQKHNAICLETVLIPNAINFAEFADQVILRPGETFSQQTTHKFSIR